jgi:hypothetical protein
VSNNQDQLCASVEVEYAVSKESQPCVVESLRVDTRRCVHNFQNILANLFPPESVERFSKSASHSYVTSRRTLVQLCDRSQSELRLPRDIEVIEAPKVPNSGFYPAVFRPLTLVPMKQVLGVPRANEINDLGLSCNALAVMKFNYTSSNNSWDFRRNFGSDGTSASQNNGSVAIGTKHGPLAICKCHRTHKRLQVP